MHDEKHASILRRTNPLKSVLWDIHKTRSMARLNDVDRDGNTGVHYAVTSARGGILKLLLNAGANPTLPNKKKCYPIHIVASQGDTNIMKILLESKRSRVHMDVKDSVGNTALHRALQHGHEALALQLLQAGADPIGTENRDGWSPLMAAKSEYWNGKIEAETVTRMHQFEAVRDLNSKIDRAMERLKNRHDHRSTRIDI